MGLRMVLGVMLLLGGQAAGLRAQVVSTFRTTKEHRKVPVETFGTDASLPALILLHGSEGPGGPYYQDQGRFFAGAGYQVFYLHYYDAAAVKDQSEGSFEDWVELVREMVGRARPGGAARKVYLVGYSQGAEIALAAGAEGVPVDGIVEWYGNLFDNYRTGLRTFPPLLILHGERDGTIPVGYARQLISLCAAKGLRCENHLYPEQGHGFGGEDLGDADRRTVEFLGAVGGVQARGQGASRERRLSRRELYELQQMTGWIGNSEFDGAIGGLVHGRDHRHSF